MILVAAYTTVARLFLGLSSSFTSGVGQSTNGSKEYNGNMPKRAQTAAPTAR